LNQRAKNCKQPIKSGISSTFADFGRNGINRLLTYFSPQAASVAAPARPKCPRYGSDTMPLRSIFSRECHDGSGGGAINANLEALDAGIEPTWRCAWPVSLP
jgi:hypothetical protein